MFLFIYVQDWKAKVHKLNDAINAENMKPRGAKIRNFTEQEFLVGMGIIIAAAGFNCRGCELWAVDNPELAVTLDVKTWRSIIQSPNFGKYMGENRFKEYRKMIPAIWENPMVTETDPWWNFSQAVEEFNQQCQDKIKSSMWKTEDESMSAWCPQKTKCGGLPNISYVIRKPEPLGKLSFLLLSFFTIIIFLTFFL